MKKIAITGALGHIGSELIRYLPTKTDCEIVMIDNMLTQRYCSLFDLPSNIKYSFYEEDIITADLRVLFKDIDIVIHLAAITNAAGSFDKADEVEQVNYVGTKRVIEACKATKSKLIFLSTTSVYGTQKNVVSEDCDLSDLKPQSPYADSKIRSEQLLQENINNLDFIILRFGTIFGYSVGMRFHTAVNKFCWQSIMNKPLTVWETAYNQKRPYLDLQDAVKAIAFIVDKNMFDCEVYNILTINAKVKGIIETIKATIDDVKIEFVKTEIMNQLSYDVSNEKLTKMKRLSVSTLFSCCSAPNRVSPIFLRKGLLSASGDVRRVSTSLTLP